jgi:flagellar capping protein FliD
MRRLAVLAALAALLLGGCAGSPPARVWAASVCSALSPWRAQLDSLTTKAQEQANAAPNSAQAKENLVRLFDGAQQSTEAARAKVEAAGVPDVDNGSKIAHSFIATLAGVRDAYAHAKDGVSGLAVNDPKTFSDGVAAVLTTLNSEYAKSSTDLANLDSVELKKAFDEVPECM